MQPACAGGGAAARSAALTSRSSRVSLKGADSKLTPPGELESMKPKSMWMRCPSSSSSRLPLCRSFTCAHPRGTSAERLSQRPGEVDHDKI